MPKSKLHRTTKLSVLTKDRDHVVVQVTADAKTLANVASCRRSYKAILGHDVSTSVVMRRAVAMLAVYLKQCRGEAMIADELAYLMRSVR